jgi:iron complex outermembrane recepter protein
MARQLFRLLGFVFLQAVLVRGSALAQGRSVSGRIVDSQGAAIANARDLVSALKNVPGVNAFTTYGVYEYYAFRGFLDSVQLVDGVRNEGNRINTQLTNVERVEVLKGPSSALYGGGALGATVNLIRKKPSATPTYEFVASAGSWGTWRGAAGAGGPLGNTTMYRLDIGGETAEGYRHNDATRFTSTPSLAWRLGDASQLNVYYTFNRDRFCGDAGLPLVDSDLDVPVRDNVLDVPFDRNYRTPQDDATSVDHNLQVVFARQLTPSWGFRNAFSYRHFDDEYFLSEGVTFDPPRTILRDYLYFKHHRRPLTNLAGSTGALAKGVRQNVVFGWEGQRYHNYTTLPENDFFAATPIDAFNYEESPGVNRHGNTPIFAPRQTFNLWTGYDWSNGLGVNVGARYLGKTFADNGNTFEVDGYVVLNLAARYRRGRLEYQLNINNLTDTEYFVPHQDYLQVYPGNPVNVLATVRVRMN